MRMTKRFLALFLALLMAFGSVPSAVLAAGEEEAAPAATSEPAPEAVSEPAPEPTAEPVPEPTAEPTPEPTAVPTAEPTAVPTAVPTEAPVEQPEQAPVVPQAPAEQEQPGVEEPMNENKDEYSSAPQAGGQSAEQGPEAGLPGFELPGVVVPTGAPETEIVAPETETGEDMNAENGIMPILSLPEADAKFNDGWTSYQYEDGRGTRSIRLNYNNGIVVIPGASALTNLKYMHANRDGNYDVNKRWFSLHIVIDGAEKTYKVGGQFDTYTETNCIVNIHNQDDAQIDYILNSFRVDGKNGSISNSGTGNGYNNHGEIGSLDMKSTGSNVYIDLTTVKRDYTLTYVANGDGVEGLPKEGMVRDLQDPYKTHTFTLDVKPTRPGYAFKGWSMSSDSTEIVGQVTVDYNQPNVTVYAVWEKSAPTAPTAQELVTAKRVQVQLKCDTKKSDGSAYHDPNSKTVEVVNADDIEVSEVAEENGVYSVTVTLKNVEGYVNGFAANKHYYNSEASYFTKLTYDAEATRWTDNAISIDLTCKLHSVTYIVEGEKHEKFEDLAEDEKPAKTPVDPTRNGYVFAGWNKGVDPVTGDIIYTARWTPDFKGAVSLDDWTYGDEHLPSVKSSLAGPSGVTVTGPELTYTKRDGTEIDPARTLKNGRPIDAGEYTVTATWTLPNGDKVTATDDFTVAKKVLDTFSCVKAVYTPLPRTANIRFSGEDCMEYNPTGAGYPNTIAKDLVDGDKLVLDVTFLDLSAENAGVYHLMYNAGVYRTYDTFKYTPETPKLSIQDATGRDVTANYDITKLSGTLVAVPYDASIDDSKFTYGEEIDLTDYVHENISPILTYLADMEKTVAYFAVHEDGTETQLPEGEMPKNVGKYKVKMHWHMDYYIEGLDAEATITILPKNVTVTAENKTVTYGDALPELTATVEDMVPGESAEELIKYALGCEYKPGDPVDTYDITVTGEEYQGNYKVSFTNGTLTVAPRKVTVSWQRTIRANGQPIYLNVLHIDAEGESATLTGALDGHALQSVSGVVNIVDGMPGEYTGRGQGVDITGAVIEDADGNDVTSNYDITYTGTLTITAQDILVDPLPDVMYDGQNHEPAVRVRDAENRNLLRDGIDYEVRYSADTKNVGPVTVTVTGRGYYDEAEAEVRFEITRRPVALTAADDEWIYDAQWHNNTTIIASDVDGVGGFVDGEGVEADHDKFASIRDAGEVANVLNDENGRRYHAIEGTDLDNYAITETNGTLTVNPLTLSESDLTVNEPRDVYYNGQAHPWTPNVWLNDIGDGTGTSRWLVNGQDYTVTYDRDELVSAGRVVATVSFTEDGNYTGSASYDYTIMQRPVTLQSADGTWTYDGQEHSEKKVTDLTAGRQNAGIVEGESFVYENFPTITDAGWKANTYDVRAGENTDLSNYKITEQEGGLRVNVRSVTLTSGSAERQYDGTPLTNGTVTVGGEGFVDGQGATYNVTGSQTIKGSSDNTFTYELNEGTNRRNYTIRQFFGTLEITDRAEPFEITLQPNGGTATYDGQRHDVGGFETLSFVANEQRFTVEGLTASASGTDAATYPVNVTGEAIVKDAEGNDVTDQFAVTINEAALIIDPKAATVNTESATRVYDGTALTAPGSIEGLVEGESATVNTTSSITDVGDTRNSGYDIEWTGAKQSNYDLSDGDIGTLTVTARPVTVNTESATRVYDGTALTAPGSVEGLAPGETATVNTTSITDVDSVRNAYTIAWGSTDSRNYTVTNGTIGTLTVTARPVTVNTESAAQVYDGTALTAAGSIEGLAPGETATVNTTSITDAATVDNDYTIAWGTADSRNYAVSDGDIGTLTVTARPVTLTSGSATRAYNGAALTNGTVTVGGQGFVGGQGAAYTVTGTRTAAGASPNTFTYRLTGGAQARNYDITTATGTLTVTPAGAGAMTVSAPTNFLYDGAAHQWTPTVTGIGGAALTAGVDYNVTYSTANFTDAGAITATITGIGNYSGTVTRTYRINQRLVIMTSDSATKTYDGATLRAQNVTVSGRGFATGEGATYNVTGSRTAAGTARNTFTYDMNAGTDADNYTVMQIYGSLTVEPAVQIEDDDTPLGGQPDDADDADGGDDAEIAEIEDDDTPLAALPVIDDNDDGNGGDGGYALNEEVSITEDATPLAGGPTQEECCILHFIIMLGALCVAMYYTHDRKKRQEREYELRAEMQQQ